MKKVLALILVLAMILSVVPANVLAAPGEIVNVTLEDTYVYDFMRESDGKFQGYETKGIITYADGSTEEEYIYLFSNVDCTTGYGDFFCTDSQNEALWEVGNTYPVEYGDGKIFNVEVREAPISRIEIDDCDLCFWMEDWQHYYYRTSYTVYFPDGSSETYTDIFFYDYLDGSRWTDLTYTDTQETEPWVLGETYEVTGTLLGVSDTFNVTVRTITDISVPDVTCIENCGCIEDGYYNEDGEYIEEPWIQYEVYSDDVFVTFSDGTTFEGSRHELESIYDYAYSSGTYSDQSPKNQWGLGEHTAYITFGYFEAPFKVIVTETPVESLVIEDITIIEGGQDYMEDEHLMYSLSSVRATVTFKDGTTEYIQDNMMYGDQYYELSHNAYALQREEAWTRGTYQVTGSFLGATDTFNVTITESPVKRVEIQDVTIIEGTKGEYYDDQYYYYDFPLQATITYQDGRTEDVYGNIELDGQWYDIQLNSGEMQNEKAWGVGTYQVTGTILGVSDTFKVTIAPTPIRKLEIYDTTVYEGGYAEMFDGNGIYGPTVSGKVTFKDGSTQEFYDSVEYNEEWAAVDTNAWELQQENLWTVGGTYEVTGTVMGVSDTFQVTVAETPIQSIEVQDLELVEGIDAYESDGDYHYYPSLEVKVTFKDGTVQYVQDEVEIDGNYYWIRSDMDEIQYEQPWIVGNTYQATATVLNVSDTFNITVRENPIDQVQLLQQPAKTSYLEGEVFDLKGATIRILYKDGTYEDFNIKGSPVDGYHIYSQKLDAYSTIYARQLVRMSEQYKEYKLFGKTLQIPITVKENLMESISVKEAANKTLVITVENKDKTSYQMTIIDSIYSWNYGSMLVTDKGIFPGGLRENEDGSISAVIYDWHTDKEMRADLPADSQWIEAYIKANELGSYFAMENAGKTVSYSGTVTAQNVDAMIALAAMCYIDDENYLVYDGEDYCIVRAEGIRKALKALLGDVAVDLKLSAQYDAKADTYRYQYSEMKDLTKLFPSQLTYSGGSWTTSFVVQEANKQTGKPIQIALKLNNRYQLVSISIGEENASIFQDIGATSWQYQAAKYAVEHNLMAGKGTDAQGNIKFDPNSSITREEFVQVLYNAEDKPSVSIANKFPDVGNGAWYKNAVLWANSQNIANGLGDGSFGIGKKITRQDLALMLYKYASLQGLDLTAPDGEINKYADGSKVSGYAQTAMNWAVKNGVLSGKGTAGADISTFRLDPAGTATRAECAAMLKNFMTAFGL